MEFVCHLQDIPEGKSKGFDLGEKHFFAVKFNGQVFVYKNSCPHLGVELNWQEDQFLDMDGVLIQCSTHGALFVIESGECVAGPCSGSSLEALPHIIENGSLYLA